MLKQEKIEFAKLLMNDISKKFLHEGQVHCIQEGYEHVREIITLFAKQTNLLESTILLLDNNMAEEAYILFRSQLNNAMLIQYLCGDNQERTRYKEYTLQPVKSDLSFLYNMKNALSKGWIDKPIELTDIEVKIKKWEELLKKEGATYKKKKNICIDTGLLSIAKMAKTDKLLFGLYMEFYREGSKYEHSDISSLDIYRTKVLDEYSNYQTFIMDLSRTNEEMGEKILDWALEIYAFGFVKLLHFMLQNYEHLIGNEYKEDLVKLTLIITNKLS